MKWKLNLPEPLMLVYYFAKFTGLAPFKVNKNYSLGPPGFLDILYTIAVAFGYLVFTAFSLSHQLKHFEMIDYGEFKKSAIIFQYIESFPVVFLTLMILLLMHGKVLSILNKLLIVGIGFKNLGIVEDHEIFFKNLLTTTTIGNAVFIAICVVVGFVEPYWPTYTTIQYGVENWLIFNTGLIFVQLLLCIRQRFALLNGKLLNLFTPTRHVGSPHDLQMHFGGGNPRSEDLRNIKSVQKIEGLHLALCHLVDWTTHLFTASVIFISLKFLSVLSVNSFWIFQQIRRRSQLNGTTDAASFVIHELFGTTFRTAIIIVELYTVAYVSSTTDKEGKATKDMLSRVWDNKMSQDLQDEFFTFDLQLRHEFGSVSILGFFDLGYPYLYKIFCAVAAYLIVMIQFDE